jgi:hypothetical protein
MESSDQFQALGMLLILIGVSFSLLRSMRDRSPEAVGVLDWLGRYLSAEYIPLLSPSLIIAGVLTICIAVGLG